jgi:MFS family permease
MDTLDPAKRRIRPGLLLGVLLIGPFMAQADATIVNVSIPSVQAGLGGSGAVLQLVVGGYLIAVAMLLITGARLGQAYGYRRAFLAGVSVFTLASLACGLAPDPAVLVVARILQGAGAGVMFPQTMTGIQLQFTGPDRVRAIGRYALALSSGAVSGQILGGVLVSANVAGLGWRAVFLVNVPVGVAAVAAALRFLPADGGRKARLDLAGAGLLSVSALLLVVPLTLGSSAGWPPWAWACLAASLPATAAFVVTENRVARNGRPPLLTMGLLRIPAVRWGLVTMAIATSTYYALMFTLAQYLQSGLGRGPVVSGLTLLPWVAAFGLAGQVVRRLGARRWVPAAGCLLLAVSFAGISAGLFWGFGGSGGSGGFGGEGLLALMFGLGGLGLGVEFAAQAGRLTAVVEPRYAADISGASSTLIQIGGAIGVAAIGALYLAGARGTGSPAVAPVAGAAAGAAAAAHAFAVTTSVLAGVALLAAAAAWRASRPASAPAPAVTAPAEPAPAVTARAERAPVASFGPRSGAGS